MSIDMDDDDDRQDPIEPMIIRVPVRGPEIQTQNGGDYTGRCYRCGSTDLWDDQTAYGCNACGMTRFFG